MTTPYRLLFAVAVMCAPVVTEAFAASFLIVDDGGAVQRADEAEVVEQGGPTAAGPVAGLKPNQAQRTGLLAVFPDAYGTFELRHRIQRRMSRDRGLLRLGNGPALLDQQRALSDSPQWELRPTIGSKFFDGKVDSAFTYVFANDVGASTLHKTDAFNYTQWNLIEGKFDADSSYLLGPSAMTDFMNADKSVASFSYSDIGLFGEMNTKLAVPTGSLALRGYANPVMEVYSTQQSKKNRSTLVRSNNQAADRPVASSPLVDTAAPDDAPVAQQQHPMYLAFYGITGTYTPQACQQLSLALGLDVIQSWKPVYKETVVPGQAETSIKLDGHERDAVSFIRFTTGYEFTKRVSLVNQLRHYSGGLWQRGVDVTHPEGTGQTGTVSWENRLSLVMTLF